MTKKISPPSSGPNGQYLNANLKSKPRNVNEVINKYDYIFPNADNSANPVHSCV